MYIATSIFNNIKLINLKETPKIYRLITFGVEISRIDFASIKIRNIENIESRKVANALSDIPKSINPINAYPHIIIVCISPKNMISNNELWKTS